MKQHIVEKNGFPKPLGLLIILAALMFTCFVNLAFTQSQTRGQETVENPVYQYVESGFNSTGS